MKKNYRITGCIGFFIDDSLHTCLEYETMYQRSQIIQDFLDKVKNLIGKGKMKIYYVISVNEESIILPKTKDEWNYKRSNKHHVDAKFVRPKAEYSNRQFNDL